MVFENVTIYVALILLLCLLRCYNRGRHMKNVREREQERTRENEVEAYLCIMVLKIALICVALFLWLYLTYYDCGGDSMKNVREN